MRAAELTDGIVSPMVGRTLRLAGYDTTFALVAGRDGRRFAPKFAAVVDWRLLELDEERQTARIPPGVELDLGATAKALAADRAAATIARATGCGALVSLGGDISVAGAAPPGGWAIRLADDHASTPDGPGPAIAIKSGGLATSSTAARRWRTASGELHHIVDPRTGRPARTPLADGHRRGGDLRRREHREHDGARARGRGGGVVGSARPTGAHRRHGRRDRPHRRLEP